MRTTREELLEVAGQVFAEKGAARATGKEICQRAGANPASINYYFGGMDGLYAATLLEGHNRIVPLEAMASAASADNPTAKLRAVITLITNALVGPASTSWVLRVFSREILAPSRAFRILRERALLPKTVILREIVAELMQRPIDDPAVSRACINIIGPMVFLLTADRRTVLQAFPGVGVNPDDAPALADHFVRYALAGVAAAAAAPSPRRR